MPLTLEDLKKIVRPENAEETMRVHVMEKDGETGLYALMTSEAKAFLQSKASHRYEQVSFERWGLIAISNYYLSRCKCEKLPVELELTVIQNADPRGNGHIDTSKFALITERDERFIISCINNGRMISMKRERVDINEWIKYVMTSYYEEEKPSPDPRYDEDMAITLDELQDDDDCLTMDERLGNR